jgi:hypothetical protein
VIELSQSRDGDPTVVLFTRRLVGMNGDMLLLKFSVEGDTGSEDARSRAIVTYEGNHSGEGKWTCHKDAHINCAHKRKALALMVRDLGWEGELVDISSMGNMYMGEEGAAHGKLLTDAASQWTTRT